VLRSRAACRGSVTDRGHASRRLSVLTADMLPDVLDVDLGSDGADLGVLRAL
jgi:hypothetical protein